MRYVLKEMKMRLIKIDNKSIYSLVPGVMCLLTLFAFAVSVKNDIFRDLMYMVRIIDLISLIFLTFLSGYLFCSRFLQLREEVCEETKYIAQVPFECYNDY